MKNKVFIFLALVSLQQGLYAQSNAADFVNERGGFTSFEPGDRYLYFTSQTSFRVWDEETHQVSDVEMKHDNVGFSNSHCTPLFLDDKLCYPSHDYTSRKVVFYWYAATGEVMEANPSLDNPDNFLFCKGRVSQNAKFGVFMGEKLAENILGGFVGVNSEGEILWTMGAKDIVKYVDEKATMLWTYDIDNEGNGIFTCKSENTDKHIISVVRIDAKTKELQIKKLFLERGDNLLRNIGVTFAEDNRMLLYANHYHPEYKQEFIHRVVFTIVDFDSPDVEITDVKEVTRTWNEKLGYEPGVTSAHFLENGGFCFASEIYFPGSNGKVVLLINKTDADGNITETKEFGNISRTAFYSKKSQVLLGKNGNLFVTYIRIGQKGEKDNVLRCLILDGKTLEPIWEIEPYQAGTAFIEMMHTKAKIWGDYVYLFHMPNNFRIISMKDGKEMEPGNK